MEIGSVGGRIEADVAWSVGAALAAIHSGTANDPKIEAAFQTDETFHAIRLEPYLEATAGMHPELSEALFDLSRRTATTKHPGAWRR